MATITFWNAGNVSIEQDDIRKPIRFEFVEAERVLDTAVLAAVHPEIGEYQLDISQSEANILSNQVGLSWKYLDPNFGVKFNVIYVSNQPSKVDIKGNILGSDSFFDSRSIAKRLADNTLLGVTFSTLFGVTISILTNVLMSTLPSTKLKLLKWRLVFYILLFLGCASGVYFLIFRGIPAPL
ncbi:MAG: hypothetical protein AAF821_25685 [Cyanobacteria bacterium P01_D01_bin.156]